jgi:hypothetical protein
MSVVEAVQRDIEKLGPEVAETGLAATALVLARRLDDPRTSSTSVSMCSKSLIDTMEKLHAAAPPKEVRDGITDIAAARAERRRRAAGVAGT